MTATHRSDRDRSVTQRRRWRARVAVRIPRETSDSLVENARLRLERPAGIEAVTVERLCDLDPALAATVAHVELDVRTRETASKEKIRHLLTTAPGTERIETVSPE